MVSRPKKIRKRALEARSHLLFEFQSENNQIKRVFVPMLENCEISESQSSNLIEYNLIGRNSNLYSYTSGKSRELKLGFYISLNHVLDHMTGEGLERIFTKVYSKVSAYAQQQRFFDGTSTLVNGIDHAKIHKTHFFDSITTGRVPNSVSGDNSKDECINLIIYWLNIIRSSTKNDSTNTTFGPPVVRVTHGVMYNNVPCVAKSYSINIGDYSETIYDLNTLLSTRIRIEMSLNEVRVGNFGNFRSFDAIRGDNNAGWETVFTDNNMDPYNGIIRSRQ